MHSTNKTNSDFLNLFESGKKLEGEERLRFLEICVKAAVCGLYEHHKNDVLNQFSTAELQDVVDSTEPFRECKVEEMFHRALFG